MSSPSTAGAVRSPRPRTRVAVRALRVLVCASDSTPITRALSPPRTALRIASRVAAGPGSLAEQLAEPWDALVVDASCAAWSAEMVLEQLEAGGSRIPLVVVCDPAHERTGAELVERGAADYLAADRLIRLPLAVRAAVERETLTRDVTRARAYAAAAREMMRVAFANYPSAAIAVDAEARVVEWNLNAERLLGWSEAEARGRRVVDLVGGEEMGAPLVTAVAEVIRAHAARRQAVSLRLLRRDGHPIHVELQALLRRDLTGGVILSLTDTTERWRSDWLKDHQIRVLGALASTGEDSSLTATLTSALEQFALSVNGTEARLWEAEPRGELQLRATWARTVSGEAAARSLPPGPPDFVERAISSGRLSFSETGLTSPGESLGIPITVGEKVLGAIEIHALDPVGFDDAVVAHLVGLGSYVASHLAWRRSESDFARSLEELHRVDAERRRLLRLLVEAHEDERRTLAADIHDDPLQVLAAVALRLHTLRRRLDGEAARHSLEAVEEMVGGSVSRLRSLMFNLRPGGLDHGDLIGPLRDRLDQVREDEHIEYELSGSEPVALTTETRVNLYRIAQEAISNVVKHASARHIAVAVGEHDGGCLLRIADDGAGPGGALAARPGHLGLPTMRERSELAGGWLRVEAGESAGTVVTAWVPLPPQAQRGAGWTA